MVRYSLIRVLGCALLLLTYGCLGTLPREPTESVPSTVATDGGSDSVTSAPTKHPALESGLVQLVSAEDRAEFADEHGLRVQGDRVLVVIELRPEAGLPNGFDIEAPSRHGDHVQAYVAIDDLPGIADHENVSFVRSAQPVDH